MEKNTAVRFRDDIQGLRAVAVIVVVLDHLCAALLSVNWQPWAFVTTCGVVALSRLWAFAETTSSLGIALFSTVSRAWELGIGAALAGLLARKPIRIGAVVSSVLVLQRIGTVPTIHW
ncbi:hypothetical protein [Mycetocola tolaasinivorans]|uniref:hypothetical protein n=1 Tax=Mycetocola tolaasinivorans TaxID=76635 RepID=UPI0011C457F4|nr:hypothetical protein [Mycetocola tolaasinivorans]